MKQKFSKKWESSKQPRKKRKYLANAPLHIREKFISATLSKELRKTYGRRSVEVRKGDEVKIMRGKFSKKQGKILSVDRKKSRAKIEGIQITKKDGAKVEVGIHTSNLKIISLNTDDKKRLKKMKVEKTNEDKTKNVKENKQTKPEEKKNA